MSDRDSDTFSLHTLDINVGSPLTSQRSSLDYAAPDRSDCVVSVFDQLPTAIDEQIAAVVDEVIPSVYRIASNNAARVPEDLRLKLQQRDIDRTRWINFSQWSSALSRTLSSLYLDDHGCLDLHSVGVQARGGPVKRRDGGYFVWVQTSVPFIDQRSRSWSSLQQCGLKMVICLPTSRKAGTIITNFTGKAPVVERISRAMTVSLLDDHAMGPDAMICVWSLAYSIIQNIARQMDLAFRLFDPLETVESIAHFSRLPLMLERSNELARIDRYTSGLAEILDFFDIGSSLQTNLSHVVESNSSSTTSSGYRTQISRRSHTEALLARQKISSAQRLCRTYIEQYDSHVQTMLSYSATQIADRLDQGRKIAERVAYIGVVLASISGLTSPLAVITGFFGMNVSEFTNGGQIALFEFWEIALPVVAVTILVVCVILLRLITYFK